LPAKLPKATVEHCGLKIVLKVMVRALSWSSLPLKG